jgi:uncharacterized protein (DUF3820 family)
MSHGKAIMPFGKYKGVRVRLIPDDYLSWLTSTKTLMAPTGGVDRWGWLRESLLAELRFRGLRADLADTPDPEPPKDSKPKQKKLKLWHFKARRADGQFLTIGIFAKSKKEALARVREANPDCEIIAGPPKETKPEFLLETKRIIRLED